MKARQRKGVVMLKARKWSLVTPRRYTILCTSVTRCVISLDIRTVCVSLWGTDFEAAGVIVTQPRFRRCLSCQPCALDSQFGSYYISIRRTL
jgi:hypothetical protein